MKYQETANCVRCLNKKATCWIGHVLRKGTRITAGWCMRCRNKEAGFVGHYSKAMKRRRWVA